MNLLEYFTHANEELMKRHSGAVFSWHLAASAREIMLRVLAAFLGPTFAKEMVEIARRKRYYLNRVLYRLALLLALFMVWERYHWRMMFDGRNSIHLMAEIAESLFHAVSVVQYCAVFLFVPMFLCGVISSEREEQTLD